MNKIHRIAHYWFLFQFAVITYADDSKRLAVLVWQQRALLRPAPRLGLLVLALAGAVFPAVIYL